jgi:hypothetical protein
LAAASRSFTSGDPGFSRALEGDAEGDPSTARIERAGSAAALTPAADLHDATEPKSVEFSRVVLGIETLAARSVAVQLQLT